MSKICMNFKSNAFPNPYHFAFKIIKMHLICIQPIKMHMHIHVTYPPCTFKSAPTSTPVCNIVLKYSFYLIIFSGIPPKLFLRMKVECPFKSLFTKNCFCIVCKEYLDYRCIYVFKLMLFFNNLFFFTYISK